MNKGPVSRFIEHHYRHFNAAALMDAAKGYESHLDKGGKMMVTLAGAMSTGELGISLAEMIRQGKVDIISCTGANLEEDVMNGLARYHELTAILDKVAAGELLGRRQDMAANQLLSHAVEQLLARGKRLRDAEALTMNMQLMTWRDASRANNAMVAGTADALRTWRQP